MGEPTRLDRSDRGRIDRMFVRSQLTTLMEENLGGWGLIQSIDRVVEFWRMGLRELFPFKTRISTLSPFCVLILRLEFGAIYKP